jgi:hypothetical protein
MTHAAIFGDLSANLRALVHSKIPHGASTIDKLSAATEQPMRHQHRSSSASGNTLTLYPAITFSAALRT